MSIANRWRWIPIPCFKILKHQKKRPASTTQSNIYRKRLRDKTSKCDLEQTSCRTFFFSGSLLFLERRKLGNDVNHKINQLNSEPGFSKQGLALNSILDSPWRGISAGHASNNSAQVFPLKLKEFKGNHGHFLNCWFTYKLRTSTVYKIVRSTFIERNREVSSPKGLLLKAHAISLTHDWLKRNRFGPSYIEWKTHQSSENQKGKNPVFLS